MMAVFLKVIKINKFLINYSYNLSKGIDFARSSSSKQCVVCHYWFYNCEFKFQNLVCNSCLDLVMLFLDMSNVAIITVKRVDCPCIVHGISNSDVIHLLGKSMLDDGG